MRTRASFRIRWSLVALSGVLPAVACGERSEIEIVSVRENGDRLPVGMTMAQRFPERRADPHGQGEQGRASPDDLARLFLYKVPEGWTQRPPQPLRVINLAVGEVECYLTVLSGGTAVSNINRWRGQLGLEPLDQAGIDALKKGELLGGEAHQVDIQGTFEGKADQRIRASYRQLPMAGISVKMFGPRDAVEQALTGYDSFCASLQFNREGMTKEPGGTAHGGTAPAGPGPGDTGMGNEGFDPKGLRAEVPKGWTESTGSSMRHVTYATGGSSECYVTFLGPVAGNWRMNVDRWVGEVGVAPPDDAGLAAMAKIEVLGQPVPVLEAYGEQRGVIAVMVALPAKVMFVKLAGTTAEVKAQRDAFVAYCKSLRIEK